MESNVPEVARVTVPVAVAMEETYTVGIVVDAEIVPDGAKFVVKNE